MVQDVSEVNEMKQKMKKHSHLDQTACKNESRILLTNSVIALKLQKHTPLKQTTEENANLKVLVPDRIQIVLHYVGLEHLCANWITSGIHHVTTCYNTVDTFDIQLQ